MDQEEIDRRFLQRCINSWAHFVDKRLQLGKGRDDPIYMKKNLHIVDKLKEFIDEWRSRGYPETESIKWAERLVERANSGATSIEPYRGEIGREKLFDIIKGRRSIRIFLPKPVEEEKLKKLVEAALWAPSGCNQQPLDFIIITDPEKVRWAAEVVDKKFLPYSPAMIIVVADTRRTETADDVTKPKELRDKPGPVEGYDTGAAVQNMLLAAHHLGLGTCWIGANKSEGEAKLVRLLGLPEFFVITAFVQVGYPAVIPPPPPRRSVEECIHWLR